MARRKRRKIRRSRKNPSVTELFERGDNVVSGAERSVSRVGGAASRAKSLTGTDVAKVGLGLAVIAGIGGVAWWWQNRRANSSVLRLT